MYNLFLDDIREPKEVTWIQLPPVSWAVVRSYAEFVEMIVQRGMPDLISFDHDLGMEHYRDYVKNGLKTGKLDYDSYQEKTGYDCAKWLVDFCMETGKLLPKYLIHSKNGIGAANIDAYFRSYQRSQGL